MHVRYHEKIDQKHKQVEERNWGAVEGERETGMFWETVERIMIKDAKYRDTKTHDQERGSLPTNNIKQQLDFWDVLFLHFFSAVVVPLLFSFVFFYKCSTSKGRFTFFSLNCPHSTMNEKIKQQ